MKCTITQEWQHPISTSLDLCEEFLIMSSKETLGVQEQQGAKRPGPQWAPPPGLLETECDGFAPEIVATKRKLLHVLDAYLKHDIKSIVANSMKASCVNAQPDDSLGARSSYSSKQDDLIQELQKSEEEWKATLQLPGQIQRIAFEQMMDRYEILRQERLSAELQEARINNEQRSAALAMQLTRMQSPAVFDHVIIGTGPNACMLYAMIREQYKGLQANGLPRLIAIGKCDDQFSRDGSTPLGQNHRLVALQSFSRLAHDYMNHQQVMRADTHVRADMFVQAKDVTQYHMQMPCLRDTVASIECKDDGTVSKDWHVAEYRYRLACNAAPNGFLYAHKIDICVGLGPARTLSGDQCTQEDQQLLRTRNSRNVVRLIYGSDYAFDFYDGEWPTFPQRQIVIYGGGARAAKCALYVLVKGGDIVHWGAREPDSPDLDPFFLGMVGAWAAAVLDKTASVRRVGTLQKVRPEGERIAIKFNGYDEIVCDQLIIAIGQDASAIGGPMSLVRSLCPLVPLYEISKGKHVRAIGTGTADGCVRVLGAAGSTGLGLSAADRAPFLELENTEAAWQPGDAQIVPGMFRAEQTMSIATSTSLFRHINSATPEEIRTAVGCDAFAEWLLAERKKRTVGFTSVEQLMHEPVVVRNGWTLAKPWMLTPSYVSWD